jgi:TetR/AcrR family transcriptional repressor of nem operon
MNEPDTRTRILNAGVEIMLERSFHSVGLNQLLSTVGVPKGSFYHYFKSKENFGVEVLRHYSKTANEHSRQILNNADIAANPIERLIFMFNEAIEKLEEANCKCPCLLQKVAIEIANTSTPMREQIAAGFNEMIELFKATLNEAKALGFLENKLDIQSESELILDLWAGAQQRAIIMCDSTPLRSALRLFRQRWTSR